MSYRDTWAGHLRSGYPGNLKGQDLTGGTMVWPQVGRVSVQQVYDAARMVSPAFGSSSALLRLSHAPRASRDNRVWFKTYCFKVLTKQRCQRHHSKLKAVADNSHGYGTLFRTASSAINGHCFHVGNLTPLRLTCTRRPFSRHHHSRWTCRVI